MPPSPHRGESLATNIYSYAERAVTATKRWERDLRESALERAQRILHQRPRGRRPRASVLPAPDARKRENWEDPATGRKAQETVDGKNEAALIIQQAILDGRYDADAGANMDMMYICVTYMHT